MSTQHDDFLAVVKDNPVIYFFLQYQYKAGSYSFSGSYAPRADIPHSQWNKEFSVGVFQWQQKADGIGLKPGKTIIRVSGSTDSPFAVYEMAMDLCRRLQDGERFPFKSISAARYLEKAT